MCRKAWETAPASQRWKEGMEFGDGEVRPGTDDMVHCPMRDQT